MNVLPSGISAYHVCVWPLWRTEEGIRSPETGVTVSNYAGARNWQGPLQGQQVLLTLEIPLRDSTPLFFSWIITQRTKSLFVLWFWFYRAAQLRYQNTHRGLGFPWLSFNIYLFACLQECVDVWVWVFGGQRTSSRCRLSFSRMWVLGTNLRSSGLGVGTFTHWATAPAQNHI